MSAHCAKDIARMFDVIADQKTVQELQLLNRKRLKHFNKLLDPKRNKKQNFKPADLEIYEPQRESLLDNWRKLRKKQEVELTQKEKEEKEMNQLAEMAYIANLEGTALDVIMNF